MNKLSNKWLAILVIFVITIVTYFIICLFINIGSNNYIPTNQDRRFGNITLDMDSTTAVKHLINRKVLLEQQTECYIPLEYKGDSIGFAYTVFYKPVEYFYIKIKDGKVKDIHFKSNLLKPKDIIVIKDNNKINIQGKMFQQTGKDYKFYYDGTNEYRLTKIE